MSDRVLCESCDVGNVYDEAETLLGSVGEQLFGEQLGAVLGQLTLEKKLYAVFAPQCPRRLAEDAIRALPDTHEPDGVDLTLERFSAHLAGVDDLSDEDAIIAIRARMKLAVPGLIQKLGEGRGCDNKARVTFMTSFLSGLVARTELSDTELRTVVERLTKATNEDS